MSVFTRESWDGRVLTMRELDEALCRVSTLFHIQSKEYETVRKTLELVAGQAEYFAKETDRG